MPRGVRTSTFVVCNDCDVTVTAADMRLTHAVIGPDVGSRTVCQGCSDEIQYASIPREAGGSLLDNCQPFDGNISETRQDSVILTYSIREYCMYYLYSSDDTDCIGHIQSVSSLL